MLDIVRRTRINNEIDLSHPVQLNRASVGAFWAQCPALLWLLALSCFVLTHCTLHFLHWLIFVFLPLSILQLLQFLPCPALSYFAAIRCTATSHVLLQYNMPFSNKLHVLAEKVFGPRIELFHDRLTPFIMIKLFLNQTQKCFFV